MQCIGILVAVVVLALLVAGRIVGRSWGKRELLLVCRRGGRGERGVEGVRNHVVR
jgi:hypothetical protein